MNKIVVTGANGQLGMALREVAELFDFQFLFYTKEEFDITNESHIQEKLADSDIFAVINTAAYTKVDQAETESDLCNQVNVEGPKLLATATKNNKQILVHVSSDYVYHLSHDHPLKETDSCHPRGVYAQSKLQGEQYVLEQNKQSIILRTSWVYHETGHNFVKTITRLAGEKSTLSVVNDQIGSPTYANDLAQAILDILKIIKVASNRMPLFGIYNYSDEGFISWFDFASKIIEIQNLDCSVIPVDSTKFPTPVERPKNSRLDKSKIQAIFGLEIPTWYKSLEQCLHKDLK